MVKAPLLGLSQSPLNICWFGVLLVIFLTTTPLNAQDQTDKEDKKLNMAVFKDSLDGKLDMSDFLINFHGFIPVPQIVTEPALGGFGIMLAPVFIQPNKHQVPGKYTPPDITAAFAAYTANKTWGFGAMRVASLPRHKLKYRLAGGYGDVNMDFYRTLPLVGEQEFGFNFNMIAAFGSLLREIGDSEAYIGLQYLYLHNKIGLDDENGHLPGFVEDKDLKSNLSSIGIPFQWDKRDNVFTPDKGWYINSAFMMNGSWTGSDYDFQTLDIAAYYYLQFSPKWVSGFRAEGVFQFGDAPFYAHPGVNLRGVPAARYQGDQVYTLETEQRYDFTQRWSGVAFAGMAKAPIDDISFSDAKLIHNYGLGFRYLIARKFKIRTGIDFAWSNDDWGWYIVFGCAWNNRG